MDIMMISLRLLQFWGTTLCLVLCFVLDWTGCGGIERWEGHVVWSYIELGGAIRREIWQGVQVCPVLRYHIRGGWWRFYHNKPEHHCQIWWNLLHIPEDIYNESFVERCRLRFYSLVSIILIVVDGMMRFSQLHKFFPPNQSHYEVKIRFY